MARKTIEIETVKQKVNNFLSESKDEMKGGRVALCVFVETILHETENYKGFSYIEGRGIIRDTTGNNNHQYPDDTRRYYY